MFVTWVSWEVQVYHRDKWLPRTDDKLRKFLKNMHRVVSTFVDVSVVCHPLNYCPANWVVSQLGLNFAGTEVMAFLRMMAGWNRWDYIISKSLIIWELMISFNVEMQCSNVRYVWFIYNIACSNLCVLLIFLSFFFVHFCSLPISRCPLCG